MIKKIDFSKNVATLCKEYPELVDILVELGFKPLKNPVLRNLIGKQVTIPQASAKMGVEMDRILFALAENGFAVSGDIRVSDQNESEKESRTQTRESGHVFLARMGKTKLRPGGVKATNWLLEQAHITPDTKILEVACNMGTTLIQIAEKYGCYLTGVDLSADALENAKKNVSEHHLEDKITLVQGNAFNLPFEDGSFDIVINEAMLTMLKGEEKDKAIAEYYRVLKPGGILLTQDVCLRTEDIQEQKEIRAGISRAINVDVEPLTSENWEKKFENTGFEVMKMEGPMTLLDSDGMHVDEGSEKTLEIMSNAMKEENAEFFIRMFNFFRLNAEKVRSIAIASTKKCN